MTNATEASVKDILNQMYDQAINDAIKIVAGQVFREELGSDTITTLNRIIMDLKKLKS